MVGRTSMVGTACILEALVAPVSSSFRHVGAVSTASLTVQGSTGTPTAETTHHSLRRRDDRPKSPSPTSRQQQPQLNMRAKAYPATTTQRKCIDRHLTRAPCPLAHGLKLFRIRILSQQTQLALEQLRMAIDETLRPIP
jgi:hypothetical protein